MKLDVEGLAVVIDKNMRESLENAIVSFDEEKGIVVSCEGK